MTIPVFDIQTIQNQLDRFPKRTFELAIIKPKRMIFDLVGLESNEQYLSAILPQDVNLTLEQKQVVQKIATAVLNRIEIVLNESYSTSLTEILSNIDHFKVLIYTTILAEAMKINIEHPGIDVKGLEHHILNSKIDKGLDPRDWEQLYAEEYFEGTGVYAKEFLKHYELGYINRNHVGEDWDYERHHWEAYGLDVVKFTLGWDTDVADLLPVWPNQGTGTYSEFLNPSHYSHSIHPDWTDKFRELAENRRGNDYE